MRVDRGRLDKLALELGKAARATARDCVFVHEGPRVYMVDKSDSVKRIGEPGDVARIEKRLAQIEGGVEAIRGTLYGRGDGQESGTCETCKYWDVSKVNQGRAPCSGLYEVLEDHSSDFAGYETPADFGCNKWEKRKS